jgi:hypothetical protein
MNRHSKGILLISLSAVAYSSAGFFTRLIHLDAWTMFFWRGLFAGLIILCVIAVHERGNTWAAIRAVGCPGLVAACCSTAATILSRRWLIPLSQVVLNMVCLSECAATGAAIDEAADAQAAIAHTIPKWLLFRTAPAGRLRLPCVRQCRCGVPEEPCGPRRATKCGRTWDNGISDSRRIRSFYRSSRWTCNAQIPLSCGMDRRGGIKNARKCLAFDKTKRLRLY